MSHGPATANADEERRERDARAPRGRGSAASRVRHAGSSHARIGERQRHVGQEDAEREEDRARGGAAGDEIQVARDEPFVHQRAEPRPRRDDLDGERSAQHAPDDHAVDREDGRAATAGARGARRRGGSEQPRASAARTDGSPSASCIACDCRRSSDAAIGSASAIAGSTR